MMKLLGLHGQGNWRWVSVWFWLRLISQGLLLITMEKGGMIETLQSPYMVLRIPATTYWDGAFGYPCTRRDCNIGMDLDGAIWSSEWYPGGNENCVKHSSRLPCHHDHSISPLGWNTLHCSNVIGSWAYIGLKFAKRTDGFLPCNETLSEAMEFWILFLTIRLELPRVLVTTTITLWTYGKVFRDIISISEVDCDSRVQRLISASAFWTRSAQ